MTETPWSSVRIRPVRLRVRIWTYSCSCSKFNCRWESTWPYVTISLETLKHWMCNSCSTHLNCPTPVHSHSFCIYCRWECIWQRSRTALGQCERCNAFDKRADCACFAGDDVLAPHYFKAVLLKLWVATQFEVLGRMMQTIYFEITIN